MTLEVLLKRGNAVASITPPTRRALDPDWTDSGEFTRATSAIFGSARCQYSFTFNSTLSKYSPYTLNVTYIYAYLNLITVVKMCELTCGYMQLKVTGVKFVLLRLA